MPRYSTRLLLTCAVIGIFGAALVGAANIGGRVIIPVFPFAAPILASLWILPATLALALLRTPGVGLLVGLLSGLAMAPFSPQGAYVILGTLWWSAPCELPFLLSAYRSWRRWLHTLGGVFAAVIAITSAYLVTNLSANALWMQATMVALYLGCTTATAFGATALAKRLRRAGILQHGSQRSPSAIR